MSATGSVNLIVCFSSSHPFAPHPAENLRQLAYPFTTVILSETLSSREGSERAARSFSRSLREFKIARLARFRYQLDFETPGISPRSASPRKHKRQMPNLRRNARGRPHSLQRLCRRVENFGFGSLLSRAF